MRTLLSPDATTQQKLLAALNAAASLLQNARESEEEFFVAFNDQIQELGLRGGIALINQQQGILVFQSVAQPGRRKVLKTLERLIGVNSKGFAVPIDQVEVYREVLTTGEAVYVSDTRKILTQVLPVSDQSLIARVVESFGGDPAIYCPLIVRDEIIGLINVAGRDLTENDLSVMKAFANYLSTALSNTRLIEELKEKESVYRSFFSNLPIGIYRVSKSGIFLMANPVFLKQFGVEDFSQLEGLTLGDKYLKPMHDRAAVIHQLKQAGKVIGLETEWEDVHGDRKFFKENIKGIYSPDGELLYYEGSFEDISEKKQTEKTIQKQLDDMRLLNRIAASGAKATSTDNLLEEVTAIISENLFPKHFGALLWDGSLGKLVVHPSYRGLPPSDYEKQFAPGEGVTGTVYQTGKPARIGDVRDIPDYVPSKAGLRSELCVPIKAGDTILGVLNAEREELDGFSQEEEILLSTIADQLATALEKAEFFEEVETQALQLSLLNEATLTTSRILEPRELINLIAKQITDLFYPDSFLISLFNESANELEIALAVEKGKNNAETTGMKTPVSQGGLTSLVIETGSMLKIDDLETSPLLVGFKHLDTEMRGSWLGIPLVSGNKVVGALTIQYYSKKVLDNDQTQFLESLASHAAIAISNGRLFNDIHRRFELSNKLAVLSEELSRPQTLPDVIEKIGRSALSLLNLEMGALYLRTGESQAVCDWSQGLSDFYLDAVIEHIAEVPGGSLLQNPEPILIPDVLKLPEDQLLRQLAEKEGLRSISLWPLVYEEKTIAAVGCYGKAPNGWAEEETDAMMTFARQAALSIQNARLLEAERNRRMEAEALYKTTTALTSTLDMNKVLDNILVELYRVVDYASASLQLLVDDIVRITAVQGFQI
ncbi:MAG: GAF domain-containing protein, partial [Anaerolineales bacterium]